MTKDEFDKLAALHKAIWKKKGIDAHHPNCLCVFCQLTDNVKVTHPKDCGCIYCTGWYRFRSQEHPFFDGAD